MGAEQSARLDPAGGSERPGRARAFGSRTGALGLGAVRRRAFRRRARGSGAFRCGSCRALGAKDDLGGAAEADAEDGDEEEDADA